VISCTIRPKLTSSDKTAAIDALVSPLTAVYPDPAPVDTDLDHQTAHPLDLSHSTRTYKILLSGGHYSTSTNTVDVHDPTLSPSFAGAAWSALTSEEAGGKDNIVRVGCGNAPFVVVELIEALKGGKEEGEVRKTLGSKAAKERIGKSVRKGANVLAEKLATL
jgi:pumilio family protein 6